MLRPFALVVLNEFGYIPIESLAELKLEALKEFQKLSYGFSVSPSANNWTKLHKQMMVYQQICNDDTLRENSGNYETVTYNHLRTYYGNMKEY